MNNKVVIIGAGSHSKVVIDILEQMDRYCIVGLIDKYQKNSVLGYPVIGDDKKLACIKEQGVERAFVAIGNNSIRKKLYLEAKRLGYKIVNAISPQAIISRYAILGDGIAVMPGAVINVNTTIHDGVIINTNASVDHDCEIGEFAHIAPGCAISGSSSIGREVFLGTGSRVIDKICIGQKTIIGAGSVVIRDLEPCCKAVGIPAKVIKNI